MKKTELHQASIHRQYGIEYEEDIPKFHIDGLECTEREFNAHRYEAIKSIQDWSKSKRIKELSKKKL